MTRQPEIYSSLTGRPLVLFLACSIVAAAANARSATAQTNLKTKGAQVAAVTEALQTSFGAAVEAVRGFQPFYLTGDFNGDGAPDILIVVRIKKNQRELPKDIKVVNPFGYSAGAAFPTNPAAKPILALAIIHGTKTGWKTQQSGGKFLLVGESPILILEYSRGISNHPADHVNLMEIISKLGKRPRGAARPPAAARGDAILLATEAADSLLYWNGKTYRWEESEGGE
jgi:hypothetical protein